MKSLLKTATRTPAKSYNRSRMYSHEYEPGQWYKTGAIATTFGFVNAYHQADHYSLSFIWNGVEYYHCAREAISEQALVRRAGKFAKEIVGNSMMGGDRP